MTLRLDLRSDLPEGQTFQISVPEHKAAVTGFQLPTSSPEVNYSKTLALVESGMIPYLAPNRGGQRFANIRLGVELAGPNAFMSN